MSIFRINRNKNYTVMSNFHFKDKRLSLKAKGLLSQMLSLPDNWDYSMNGLAAINKENITAIKTALKELKSFGYLVITKKMPGETESGRIEYIYDIYELPKEKQQEEKQPTENLGVENHTQLNTNNKKTNNKSIKNKLYNDEFEKLWKKYPRKQGKSNALKAYVKARNNGIEFITILKGLDDYINYIEQNNIDVEYIKHGSTWFNQQCWNDDYSVVEKEKRGNYTFGGTRESKSTWGCTGEASYDIEELMKIK